MKTDLTKKKTFLLCGHAQSGKTSIAEALLFKSGAVGRLGKVEEANTVSDYEDDEKERCSSINLSVLNAELKGDSLQFIDTPGYLDFIGDLISGNRGADFGVLVVDAASGVEVGTEKAWDMLNKEGLPCCIFINKLDKENTSFEKTLEDIRNSLSKKAIPFAVLDSDKAVTILDKKDNPYYAQIVETVAESDDALLEKYLESGSLDEGQMLPALKKAVINSQIFPVVAGIAYDAKAVEGLMEVLVNVMPSVADINPRKAKKGEQEIDIEPKVEAPLVAQVFKTIIDPFVGQLNIFRVYSGKIFSNSDVYNARKGGKEKIGQLYSLQGKQQAAAEAICAGDIGAVAKLKDTKTLDVFVSSAKDIVELPALQFPTPAYSASVKPKTRQDEDKISTALSRLTSEDPTIKVSRDSQTGELIISGMGELHLNLIIDRMKRKYGANVELGTPKVPYLETITKAVQMQYRHKKQTGGHGQFGDVSINVEPLERGKSFEFVDKIVGGAIPRNFIPSVEKGVKKAMQEGVIAGFPVADIRVTLYDGSYHSVDSSDMAFQIAASQAMRKALDQAGCVLLEPIMNVEIVIPGEFMGQINSSISSHRGRVLGMDSKGKNEVVKALMPLSEMFKYASDLRSVTGGRGSYTMSFSNYEVVPTRMTQTVIAQNKKDKKEE